MWRLGRRTKLSKPCLLTWKAGLQAPRLCLHCRPIILALTLNLNFGVLNPKHCHSQHRLKTQNLCLQGQVSQNHVCYFDFGSRQSTPPQNLGLFRSKSPRTTSVTLTLGPNSQHRLKTFASTVKSPRTTSATVTASPDSQHRLTNLPGPCLVL